MDDEEIITNSKSAGIVDSDRHGGLHEESPGGDKKIEMFLCELCDTQATALRTLREHYLQKHVHVEKTVPTVPSITARSKKKHECPHCDYRSNLVGHVKRHILIHTEEKPFGCSHCDFKFRDKTTLRRHIERHLRNTANNVKYRFTKDKKYQCKKCHFTTLFKGALSRHVLRHEDPKICQHCGAQFWKDKSYENHILLHAGVVLHPCKSCDYKTNYSGDLKNHVNRMHLENKLWVCSECNYATNSTSDLSKHKIIHKSDRPYACESCEYTCKRRSHLMAHQATHNHNLKNYCCPFCDYKTILIGTLRIHVRKHTGEKPFKCSDCGLAFASHGGVRAHAYTHVENWSQSCPHCNFTASKPHLFRKHMQLHKEKPGTPPTEIQNNSMSRLNPSRTEKKKKLVKSNARVAPQVKSKPKNDFNKKPPPSQSLTSSNSPTHDDSTYCNGCKPDPDDLLIKSEPECLAPTLLELGEANIEDIDIFYPVKQECDTP